MTLDAILAAIGASAPAAALRASFVAYPLVSAAHVLGAGGLVVLVWLMHAALAGRAAPTDPDAAARFYRRLVVGLLLLMVFSGLALFSVRPADYAANPAFRIKLALIAAALANVAAYHALCRRRPALARLSAIVSIAVWPAILVAGRFVGFV